MNCAHERTSAQTVLAAWSIQTGTKCKKKNSSRKPQKLKEKAKKNKNLKQQRWRQQKYYNTQFKSHISPFVTIRIYIYSFVFTSSYARSLWLSSAAKATPPSPFVIPNNNKINIFLALFYVLIFVVSLSFFSHSFFIFS